MGSDSDINIILLGKTGSGKSSLRNNLLGRIVFETRLSAGRVTRTVNRGISKNRFGHTLVVLDTPDFTCDETSECDDTKTSEIAGPHAFLFVTSVGEDPYSLQESFETFRSRFTDDVLRYTVIVFTREHDLRRDNDLTSTEDYVRRLPHTLRRLVVRCRCIFLDNAASGEEREPKLRMLIRKVSEIRKENQPETFTIRTHTYCLRKRNPGAKEHC